ncbi:MAG: ABC transporter substrate-binding protein [Acholeplasmataceae bacterium]
MKHIKTQSKKLITILLILSALLTVAACTQPDEIIFGQGDWDSNLFHDEVARYIIEEGYGVATRSVSAETSVMIATLTTNDIDVAMEIWSDNLPTYQDDLDNGLYQKVSVNFDDNAQGLYIPAYLQLEYPDLVTVEDLKDYAHLFEHPEGLDKGIIYGGPEGWGATAFLDNKITAYGLDEFYEFRKIDSNTILSSTLADAYSNEEPWVGYNWEPTWIMGIYDMVLLEDSAYSSEDFAQGIGAFPSVSVDIVVSNDFADKYPEITAFLSNYRTTSDITSQALGYMSDNDASGRETAIWFLKNNQSLWSNWVPTDIYDKVMASLDLE